MWALLDYGFAAVVSPGFADIFRNNCTKAGLVPVQVDPEVGRALLDAVVADPSLEITIDVNLQFPQGTRPGDLDMTRLKKLVLLTGGILTLDPHKPIPPKEEKIGLFPKL